MTENVRARQENLLTDLGLASAQVNYWGTKLEFFRTERRRLAEALISSSDLPLAEIARVAGVHRHTIKAWKDALEDRTVPELVVVDSETVEQNSLPSEYWLPLKPEDPDDEAISAD